MKSLGGILDARELMRVTDWTRASVALRFPWCQPSSAPRRDRARALGCALPAEDGWVGAACLVSVTPGADCAALWCFGPARDDAPPRPIHGSALDAWNVARAIAARDLPLLGNPAVAISGRDFRAHAIFVEGDGADDTLDGPSYGLSMCLAIASRYLNLALPSDLVATAVVNGDGSLGRVDSLARKLELIWGSALGVRRVLVAKGQQDEARAALLQLDPARRPGEPPLELLAAPHLHDAFALALDLPALAGDPGRLWPDLDAALGAAERFYRVALSGSSTLLSWRGVAHAAERLGAHLEALGAGREARDHVSFARSVALRHASSPDRVEWPDDAELARMPRPERLGVLAHVVQAAADGDDAARALSFAAAARWHVEPRSLERHDADLRLLGAIGRALAAGGNYADGRKAQREALDGWLAIRREADASYALCEALRVAALLGNAEAVRSLESAIPRIEAYAGDAPATMAFVRLALGRARVLLGDHRGAAEALDGKALDWDATDRDVSYSRLRWWAKAQVGLGNRDAAGAARTKLADVAARARTVPDAALLAELDLALEGGADADVAAAASAVERHADGSVEVAKLRAHERAPAGDPRAWGRYVAEHYRY